MSRKYLGDFQVLPALSGPFWTNTGQLKAQPQRFIASSIGELGAGFLITCQALFSAEMVFSALIRFQILSDLFSAVQIYKSFNIILYICSRVRRKYSRSVVGTGRMRFTFLWVAALSKKENDACAHRP